MRTKYFIEWAVTIGANILKTIVDYPSQSHLKAKATRAFSTGDGNEIFKKSHCQWKIVKTLRLGHKIAPACVQKLNILFATAME